MAAAQTLEGENARVYLEQTSEGQSLMQAVTAERFGLKLEERDPISGESGAGYLGMSHDQNLNAWFDDEGVTVRPTAPAPAWKLGFRLTAYGYGDQLMEAPPIVSREVKGSRIEYARAADFGMQISDFGLMKPNIALNPQSAIRTPQLVEWYENRSEGIEQGFTINERPTRSIQVAAAEPMRVSLGLTGDLRASVKDNGQRIELVDAQGQSAVSYSKLTAVDANHKQLAARMEASEDGREIALVVEDSDAAYPIVIDPIVAKQETQLRGSQVDSRFGFAVAIDGNRAVVGAWREDGTGVDSGAVYHCFREGASWNIEVTDVADSASNAACGWSVAVHGFRTVFGCPGANSQTGRAFLRINSDPGTANNIEITVIPSSPGDQFGYSVAISGDAVVVGSPFREAPSTLNAGAAYTFLVASDGYISHVDTFSFVGADNANVGTAVAIDGDTAIVGIPGPGLAGVLTLDSNKFILSTRLLVAADGEAGDQFGGSVDISGNKAVVGAWGDDDGATDSGAAYVFVRNANGEWSQQQKFKGNGGRAGDHFSEHAVAIEGNTIVVGATGWDSFFGDDNAGAVYIFTRNVTSWTQETRIDGASAYNFGIDVDISGDTLLVGARGADVPGFPRAGAAFVYHLDCTAPYNSAAFLLSPASASLCPGSSVHFIVLTNNKSTASSRYQWRRNGEIIQDSTDSSYRINSASVSDAGSYDVIVSNNCGSETSTPVSITVYTFSLSPATGNFGSGGSDGSTSVTSIGNCTYAAVPSASWITITSNGSGTVPKLVGFHVDPNPSPSQRTGTITIGDKTFTVTQDGLSCSYSIAPTSQGFTATGGTNSISVTTAGGCAWTAQSNSPFITINSGNSGNGSGTVNYSVAANTGSARSGTITIAGQAFTVNQAAPTWEAVVLTTEQVELKTWTLQGRTYAYVKLLFPNAGYRVPNWGQPVRAGNNLSADAQVEKFNGPSVLAVTTTAQIYDLGPLTDGSYVFTFKNSGVAVKSLAFTVSSAIPPPNPIDNAREFVRQQYRDFLNREADQAGEDFWTDNITKCSDPARRPAGQTEAQCTTRQRETTSGAFFQSPEFQYTGYFVYRMYQGALGRQPKLSEFTPDALFVGNGIIVNGQLSAAKINQNKAAFAAQFVNCIDPARYRCSEFKAIYDGLSNQQYVDLLFLTTGVNASASDRTALVNGLNALTETRATVLQKVVDGINVISEGNQQFTTSYGQAFYNNEFNRAFVQLEYFGYMKRDPDDGGYAFWLTKLNQFGGNFVNAEMVLAFISSPEYRARFGQP